MAHSISTALTSRVATWLRLMFGLLILFSLAQAAGAEPAAASAPEAADIAPLVIGHRPIHTFRVPLGAFTASERAEGARMRILKAFEESGEGWTSVRPQGAGVQVELDGKPLFEVLPGDAAQSTETSVEQMANSASHALQKAWAEARERRDPRATLGAMLRVALALVALAVVLLAVWRAARWVRDVVTSALLTRAQFLADATLATRITPIFLGTISRSCVLLGWLLSLLALFMCLAYSLDQFAITRALGEGLFHAFFDLLLEGLASVASALPGLFFAVLIFLAAWVGTQVSTEVFNHVASGRLKLGMLDSHTAPATRRIVNACMWLFALAMAYPYLPGAQSEAFKGLSVILGIMVSIGASGLVGQIASGVILVYTRALSLGEYVSVQDCEGTVTEIGLFVTRLRTGLGSEYALPNTLVLSNVTRNFSREAQGPGHVLETAVTIGYDTPWRQVHALLLGAAESVADIARQPAPYVVQSGLSDFYVVYKLVVYVAVGSPSQRAQAASALNASIQDMFNRYGVQIMSPGYYEDPAHPKVVPEDQWYAAPARRPDEAQVATGAGTGIE